MSSAATLRAALEETVGRLPALRDVMGTERERVRSSYSWDVHLDELAHLYEELLDGQA
jgi:glycosyltransferase involved in cell wall biosynthesis